LSYEKIARQLECDCKTVDNALQRIKRKVDLHLESRKVLQ
jgi:RNA polymerase sporulation-specific sigma factor